MRSPVARGLARLVVVILAVNALLFLLPYRGPLPGEASTAGTVVEILTDGRGSGFNAYLVCAPVVRFEAGAGSYDVSPEGLRPGAISLPGRLRSRRASAMVRPGPCRSCWGGPCPRPGESPPQRARRGLVPTTAWS